MGSGGKLHGCAKFLKYSLLTTNVAILICGITAAWVGISSLGDQHVFETLVEDELFKSSSYVLIGCGILAIFSVVVGTYGAYREIKCFLLTYIIALFIFFVVLMIGGILAHVFRGKMLQPMKIEMMNTMKAYNSSDTVSHHWDDVQNLFQCCGIDSYADWDVTFTGKIKVPPSCCKRKDQVPTCEIDPTPEEVWLVGCLARLKDEAKVVGGVGIAVSCFMGIGVILGICVFRRIT